MEFRDEIMPPVEVLQQMSECCEEIEDAVRIGLGRHWQSISTRHEGEVAEVLEFWEQYSVEPYVERFDEAYRPLVREEFRELVRELRGGGRDWGSGVQEGVGVGDVCDHRDRYEVLETLAEGGMGRVSIAWDREFSRRVAIKSIQPQVLSTREVRTRFEQEARITAKLEHPGVLPVYSRGESLEEGPYYAMRLIAGGTASSLHRAIRELHEGTRHGAEFARRQRVLLRHVINVCNTMGYAHDRGVCHRDLKPSNILIGPFGETFVVDWGLAKIFREGGEDSSDSGESGRVRGESIGPSSMSLWGGGDSDRISRGSKSSIAGTPGYRAPESMGRDEIGDWPKVDVYSIGAILHCIIYGRSPTKSEAIRSLAVEDDAFFWRLAMNRGKGMVVSSKLLAISSKAMHGDLAQRYGSMLAIANDLENYLSGEPISARGEGIVERGIRWMGKHRYWAVAGLVAGICLGGAALMVALMQTRHNRELQLAATALQRAFESEELHRVQEGRLRELAERNARVARDREGLAIEALRSYCEAIYRNDALKNSASLIGLRQQLLEEPIEFFRELSQVGTELQETSLYYLQRLAQTAEELAKLSFEYGDYGQCESWVTRSIERYENLDRKLQEDALGVEGRSDFHAEYLLRNALGHADSYRLQGMIRVLRGDRPGAKESLEIAKRLLQSSDSLEMGLEEGKHTQERMMWLDKRAELYHLLAIFEAEGGDVSKVVSYFEIAVDSREKIVQLVRNATEGSKDWLVQRERAANRRLQDLRQDRAHVFLVRGLGDRDESLKQFQEYIAMLRETISGVGANESERLRLAWAHHNLGGHYRQSGAMREAEESLEEALQLREELLVGYPSVVRYRADLARTLAELAQVQVQLGRTEAGCASMQASLEGMRRLGVDVPASSYGLDAILQLHQWGHFCVDMGMRQEGEAAFADALRDFEEAYHAGAASVSFDRNPGLRTLYLELLRHRAELLRSNADYVEELKLRHRMVQVTAESLLGELVGEMWREQLHVASAALLADVGDTGEVAVPTMAHRREVFEALQACCDQLEERRIALGSESQAWRIIRDEAQQQVIAGKMFEMLRSEEFLEQLQAEERTEWESLWSRLGDTL